LTNVILNNFQGSKCCGYGSNGLKTQGYDCVIIPGAAKVTSPFTLIGNQAFCGAAGLLYTDSVTSKTGGKTVCSKCFFWRKSSFGLEVIFAVKIDAIT
jgi:hypothetical protein